MKYLLCLLLLAGCTGAPAESPTHDGISALLRKNMDDPASYQPVRWSKPDPHSVHDSIAALRYLAASQIYFKNKLITIDSTSVAKYGKGNSYAQELLTGTRASLGRNRRERDSLYNFVHQPIISNDTAAIGYFITHAFRAKNKLGSLVLDSANFYVDKKGHVTQM